MTASYVRYRAFYARWGSLIQLVQGAIVVVVSLAVLGIALTVQAQQTEQHAQRVKERAAVSEACLRSRRFGPPFIAFIDETQRRLGLTAIDQEELTYYRNTIPAGCPAK